MAFDVPLPKLQRFAKAIESDLRMSGNGPIRAALRQWAVRYSSFTRERFLNYARGGGDWKPLAASTIAGRRKGRGKKKGAPPKVSILIDTGLLIGSLDPRFAAKPGPVTSDIPFGVRVTAGGTNQHSKGITFAKLVAIHHHGIGRVPQRKIIVFPSASVIAGMKSDMVRAIGRLKSDSF